MMGLYYQCKHCHKGFAFALPGSMYHGGASLQTVQILQNTKAADDNSIKDLVDHLKKAHSIGPPWWQGEVFAAAMIALLLIGLFVLWAWGVSHKG